MMTREGKNIDRDAPRAEYPRPQFKRNSYFSLNGEWDFRADKSERIPENYPEKIKDILCRDDSIPLTEEIMITAGWMKQRYGITFWEGVRCFIPAGPPAKAGKEKEPYQGLTGSYEKPKHLTEEQQVAADRIGQAIREEKQENFLIHGVTSSGKTEVYMEAIDQCLNRFLQFLHTFFLTHLSSSFSFTFTSRTLPFALAYSTSVISPALKSI